MDIKEFSNDSYVSGGDVCMLCPFVYPLLAWGGPKNVFFCPKIIVFARKSSFPSMGGRALPEFFSTMLSLTF